MKVFCPIHEKSFSAPRRNPIKCETKAHSLELLISTGKPENRLSVTGSTVATASTSDL